MDTNATLKMNRLMRELKGTSDELVQSVSENRNVKLEQINERRDAIVKQLFAHLRKEGGLESAGEAGNG